MNFNIFEYGPQEQSFVDLNDILVLELCQIPPQRHSGSEALELNLCLCLWWCTCVFEVVSVSGVASGMITQVQFLANEMDSPDEEFDSYEA